MSGAAPIIDTAATDVSFTYTKELMNTIPNARDVWAMVSQAPGMTTTVINVGGTNTGNQTQFRAHGTDPRQNTFILAGANVTDNSGTGGSQFYYDIDSFDEMQIEMNSHGADVQSPGVILNMVPRSGTNLFRGTGSLYYGNDRVQADNVDARPSRPRRRSRQQPQVVFRRRRSTSAGRSSRTRSGSGARSAIRRSSASSPAPATPTARSRSTGRSCGIRPGR